MRNLHDRKTPCWWSHRRILGWSTSIAKEKLRDLGEQLRKISLLQNRYFDNFCYDYNMCYFMLRLLYNYWLPSRLISERYYFDNIIIICVQSRPLSRDFCLCFYTVFSFHCRVLQIGYFCRFSPEARESHDQFHYFPFGVGPRNCVGMRLALMEMKMSMVHVLQKLKFVVCEKTQVAFIILFFSELIFLAN